MIDLRLRKLISDSLYKQALDIAQNADVSTPHNGTVVYSVSFLPTRENKDKAFAYVQTATNAVLLDLTVCGKKLVELGFDSGDLSEEDKLKSAEIWQVASQRFIRGASGNITAFVNGADPRSVFCKIELPEIMKNPAVDTINGIPKNKFRF